MNIVTPNWPIGLEIIDIHVQHLPSQLHSNQNFYIACRSCGTFTAKNLPDLVDHNFLFWSTNLSEPNLPIRWSPYNYIPKRVLSRNSRDTNLSAYL